MINYLFIINTKIMLLKYLNKTKCSLLCKKDKKVAAFIHRSSSGYVMFPWGVAVLELDGHPGHNKGQDPCTLC